VRERTRWLVVVVFAMAMAWLEAATVYDLRVLVDRVEPYQTNPLPMPGVLGRVELVREAATLVMLCAVGILAGRTGLARASYAAVAFGVWDVFYYVFLRAISGWPRSLFDWDILFLLPLPWWGPVLAPVLIAALMIVGGTLAVHSVAERRATRLTPVLSGLQWLGAALALYVFMADALGAVRDGRDVRTVLPQTFDWPMFSIAFALMAAPVGRSLWRLRPGPGLRPADDVAVGVVGCDRPELL
jgi:hypothetical protein